MTRLYARSALFLECLALFAGAGQVLASPTTSSEDFLNHLGVNTHLNGLTRVDPWNSDPKTVGAQLRYLGVRLDRDWLHSPTEADVWREVQKSWDPLGRFWTSIDEAGPVFQRIVLGYSEMAALKYPRLIYALGGANEEDNTYPQAEGSTLPDSALVQKDLYKWAHAGNRNIPVSQMEFGSGWTASNNWQGDYNPTNTGIHQNYAPGPADFAAAHTYMHQAGQLPSDVLGQVRILAHLTTPGNPVAHTEVGAYKTAMLSAADYGKYIVEGAFDSFLAGDAAYIVYGLQDSDPENTYGFYSYPSNVPHEAAGYFHNLTTILKTSIGAYGPGTKSSFRAQRLLFTLSDASVSSLAMQKPDGRFVLALWSEQLLNGSEISKKVRVTFPKRCPKMDVYDIEQSDRAVQSLDYTKEADIHMLPDNLYVIEIGRLAKQLH